MTRIMLLLGAMLAVTACGGGKDQAAGDHAVAVNSADTVGNETGAE